MNDAGSAIFLTILCLAVGGFAGFFAVIGVCTAAWKRAACAHGKGHWEYHGPSESYVFRWNDQ
jgi:hypothetical protein